MLLIDGVKYEEWEISNEDELEQMVVEHSQGIFGENSIYFDKKQRLKSLAGVGSIPDGLVIVFGNMPEWYIVEVELSSHDPYAHIVPQVDKFLNGIDNRDTRNRIIEALYGAINGDEFLKLKTRQAIGLDKDTHKFLSDLIVRPPTITIVIEKDTKELREALNTLRYPEIRVVEFQTFTREGVGLAVHAHIFEPLGEGENGGRDGGGGNGGNGGEQVTVRNLIEANIIKVGQVIYKFYRGQRFEAKVLDDGRIELASTGKRLDALSKAATEITKKKTENGWRWWRTIHNGKEYKLAELREEYRATHP